LLAMGCNQDQNVNGKSDKVPVIIYNGKHLDAKTENVDAFINEIITILRSCDDLYELIVTSELIETIKGEGSYLEVIFPEKQIFNAGKFNKIEIDRMLIPLSGKFAQSGQVTFFTGIGNYSNTPFINVIGLKGITEALKKIID
jgi:hypothetical protein